MKRLFLILLCCGMLAGCGGQTQEEYDAAYNAGYEEGYADGHSAGVEDGKAAGYDAGWESGYNQGYDAGLDMGAESVRTEAYPEGTLILNKNSKKIHKPGCSGVASMKESNKIQTTESVDALIAQGYDPCDMCQPE